MVLPAAVSRKHAFRPADTASRNWKSRFQAARLTASSASNVARHVGIASAVARDQILHCVEKQT